MKIDTKYLEQSYKVIPISVPMDFSETALETALIELNYEFGAKYILHVGKWCLRDIINLTRGLHVFSIYIEIENDLIDEWYLVDKKNRAILYSPGV